MRGKSANPNIEKLDQLAKAIKVERNWLLYGNGDVEGEPPVVEDPDEIFVAVPLANVRPSMGGGAVVDAEPAPGRPYHFQKSWIKNGLRSNPADLRIMHVEGDSMMPTLNDGDIVLDEPPPRPAYLSCTTAWASSPNGWSTSPTAIHRR